MVPPPDAAGPTTLEEKEKDVQMDIVKRAGVQPQDVNFVVREDDGAYDGYLAIKEKGGSRDCRVAENIERLASSTALLRGKIETLRASSEQLRLREKRKKTENGCSLSANLGLVPPQRT